MDKNRFFELYERANERGYNTFSPFLNMDEQSELASLKLQCTLYGGYDMAERRTAGFGCNIEVKDFPISYIKIEPLSAKFAEKPNHRDILGAVMSLGIKRELIGDIIIDDMCAYIFALDKIADYLCENLTKIRHTAVKASASALPQIIINEPESTPIITASLRLDAIISAVYKLSRNEAVRLISGEKVFINSRLTKNLSQNLKENDIVSVRGFGRFKFERVIKETKKLRLLTSVKKY